MSAELILDFQQDLPSSSVFTIPYADDNQKLRFFAELHNRYPDSKPRFETPFPSELRGLGKLEHDLPEPLSDDPDQLEMADLVLGWQMREDFPEGTLFPFVVANNREIPEGEELAVHLEIYNLQQESEFASFTLDYEIVSERRMKWLRGGKKEVSLTLSMETRGNRFVEDIEIRTRELTPGSYTLRLIATDNATGQKAGREIEFLVVEKEESDKIGS